MNSEDITLKEPETLRSSSRMLKNEVEHHKKTQKTIIEEEYNISKTFPLIHIRPYLYLSESVINYLGIGLCLFIYGCYGLKWFDIKDERYKQFYLGYFLLTGITLYIIGIFNWYEGKELIFLLDFVLSFLLISIYFKNQENIFGFISDFGTSNDKLEGIFYILLFCLLLVIGISSKEKGIIYIIDYAILFVTYAFLFVFKFFKTTTIGQIDNYLFIISGGLFWLTGLFKLFNSLLYGSIVIFELTD